MAEKKDSFLQSEESTIKQVERLVDVFKKIQKYFKGKFYDGCKNLGLTVPQYTVVMHLAHMPEITLNELSDHLMLSPSTVSGIIDRLVNQGIVVRRTPKENRRIIKLSLSEEFIRENNLISFKEKLFLEVVEGVDSEVIEKAIGGLETFYSLLNRKCADEKESEKNV